MTITILFESKSTDHHVSIGTHSEDSAADVLGLVRIYKETSANGDVKLATKDEEIIKWHETCPCDGCKPRVGN